MNECMNDRMNESSWRKEQMKTKKEIDLDILII